MKLVSSKTSMPPPSANPAPHQPHDIAKQINAESSSEVLQLRLENSELRLRLEDYSSHTDESKSELLRLLEEQTTQTNLLQSKCDELAAGFFEIDKERRALRKSADDARQDSMHLVERTRAECEQRCEVLEERIEMREKEVKKLAERTREQERRIEAVVSEWHDRQSKVDELEGELEELILLVEKEREARKKAHEQHAEVMEEVRMKEEGLERRVYDLQHSLQDKEAVVANLQQEHELSKMEHEQALKIVSDLVEVQKADVVAQNKTMNELHRKEKFELMNTLQSQIDEKAKTIQSITSEMKQIQIMHSEKVAELESSIREWKEHSRAIEMKYQQSCESNVQLQCDLERMQASQNIAQEEVKTTKYSLEKENGDLVKELDEAKAQLAIIKEKLSNLQMEHTGLQCEFASLDDKHSDLNEKQSLMVGKMERMMIDCDEKISQLSNQKSAIEEELKKEKILNSEVSTQLRELNAKVSKNVSVLQREKGVLEQELENLNGKLCAKENDSLELHSRYESMVSSHLGELEFLKSKHSEEISVIEMRGADIVNDLEKALADYKFESEQVVNSITLDKERVERSLHDKERKIMEQDGKIILLIAYAKERKEEVRLVNTELAQVRHSLECTQREHDESIVAMRNELESSHEAHQREMSDLKTIIDEVRLELSIAKERLVSDDGELERAKSTLSERTNLLRDMVNQTTAYQGDYEHERARANTLDEAVSSYKRQLAEARKVSQQLEREIHEKDTQYCDAIRNERQQRKTMESEFESSRKLFEDLARKLDEMEKENSVLKDKVSRQENYIKKLQEREQRERRSTAFSAVAASGSSRSVRPSTAGSKDKHRGKIISSFNVDENLKPNLK